MKKRYTEKEYRKIQLFTESILNNKYIPNKPTIHQARFLMLDEREALYGGSAGGGKSDALLMGALQYVDLPNYSAIIFRKTFTDLNQPGALIHRSLEWLAPWKEADLAHWNVKNNVWTFPSGAKLQFGYIASDSDKYKYQGAEFQYIGFDELTQFTESQYLYLHSRLRRLKNSRIPLRIRAASNPGGIGHEWVKRRFIPEDIRERPDETIYRKTHSNEDGTTETLVFVPAKLKDNPHLDQETYMKGLMQLDHITRQQLLNGDWTARQTGGIFKREWFLHKASDREDYGRLLDEPPSGLRVVRYWDCAATEKKSAKEDPDYTCGVLLGEKEGRYYVLNVTRFRDTPQKVEEKIAQTAYNDKKAYPYTTVRIWMEEERGSSGKMIISHYARNVLQGYSFRGHRSTGDKHERAVPVSSAAEQGFFHMVKGAWNDDFIDEVEGFPHVSHDDQVDALSGAFDRIQRKEAFII